MKNGIMNTIIINLTYIYCIRNLSKQMNIT